MAPERGGEVWNIAVNAPLRNTFSYLAPKDFEVVPGESVRVPFGPANRLVTGLVVGPSQTPLPSDRETKSIADRDPEKPLLTPAQLKWLQWISDYYLYPLGQIHQLVFPPLKKKSSHKGRKSPIVPELKTQAAPFLPTPEQQQVLSEISVEDYKTYLLHGVTGSGKTEVYIEVIAQALERNRAALVLVPEISLTPQLIRRFAERFPDEIAVLHSQLTEREKTDQWWQVIEKKKRLLIGARSALFCPIPDLGLIVVDEEHETSFKQEEKFKYNARDIAVVKAKMENCPILLGSATPSLESWQNVQIGKYHLLTMKERVSKRPLPVVQIVNPHDEAERGADLPYWLSKTLYNKLKTNFAKDHQAALFLNRRGVAPTVQCNDCGFVYHCPNCDISLTLHGSHHLVCHYCNYHDRLSHECPSCKEGEPKSYGLGTEAVENDLARLFPEARIFRADRDEITGREALEEMIQKMETNEIDFLVGTQMIAKGLDFKNLTLVGVVLADVAFNVPDFRANERSFQLCTQVSGRAGRHQTPGEVVIQTYKPNHASLLAAQDHDYIKFVSEEMGHRELFHYPPFGKITAIRMTGMREQEVIHDAKLLARYLTDLVQAHDRLKNARILGPTPAPLTRIKNRYRYHLLIKSTDAHVVNHIGNSAFQFIKDNFKKTKGSLDVDPYSLL